MRLKQRLAAASWWVPFGAGSFPPLAWLSELSLERAATGALGLPVRVGPVRTCQQSGEFEVSRITVANPPGFSEPHLLGVAELRGNLELSTLGAEVIRVPRLELEDVELTLEQSGGRSNFSMLVHGFGASERSAPSAMEGPGLTVGELLIRGLRARIQFGVEAIELEPLVVEIAELRFDEVGSEGSNPLVRGRFLQLLVGALARAVLAKGHRIPGLLARDLAEQLTSPGGAWPIALRPSVSSSAGS